MLDATHAFKKLSTKKKYDIKIPIDVQRALKFPIENLYTGQLKRSEKTRMGKCPFHEDETPSFAIYPETNSWFCFSGCGGGDVIKFYMRLHGCDFSTAVEELSK